ncbi:MAG: hypothetical protein ACI4SF_15825 [Oscillospiraceae bacterium]
MNKRKRKKIYKKYMDDIVWEISCNHSIRALLFSMPYNIPIEISLKSQICYNELVNKILSKHLVFWVEKVYTCPEEFEEGLIIFKFTAKFRDIVRYSGNNLSGFELLKDTE